MSRKNYWMWCIPPALLWLWACWPALISLHRKWSDIGDSYVLGYPLIVASLWLVYSRRKRLLTRPLQPSWWGIGAVAATIAAMYAARLVQFQIVQQILVPLSLWSLLYALAGWSTARGMILPVALQYFGMPVWDPLIVVLRSITIIVTHTALAWMQVPVWLDGNQIHLPYGVVMVEDACSGLNLFLAALLIATLQVQVGHYSRIGRFAVLAAAGGIGLIDNWIRVIALTLIAYYSHMQNPLVRDHASFGWWIYAVSLIPLFWIMHRFEQVGTHISNAGTTAGYIVSPVKKHVLAAVAILAFGAIVTAYIEQRTGRITMLVPSGVAQAVTPSFIPQYAGYDRKQAWCIRTADGNYELLTLIYQEQKSDKKLIHYQNVIADSSIVTAGGMVATTEGRSLNFAVLGGPEKRIVWWYYWVDGQAVSKPLAVKLHQVRAMLLGDPSAALVALSRSCEADCVALAQDEGLARKAFEIMFPLAAK